MNLAVNVTTQGETSIDVEVVFQFLFQELQQSTKAIKRNCNDVSVRIADEVMRICNESQRIKNSGAVESSAITLARHRLQQCLRYYQLGSTRGEDRVA